MIKIKTPVNGYNGVDCGVRFENGKAEVEALSDHVLNWFIAQGYTVELEEVEAPLTPNEDPEAGKNAGNPDEKPLTKAELLEKAKALGIENIKSKPTNAELEELIAAKEAELKATELEKENEGESGNVDPEAGTPNEDPEAGEQENEDPEKGE